MAYSTFVLVPVVGLIICAFTFVWTTVRYRLALRNKNAVQEPAHIPYTIPWLGSTRDFLNPQIGSFANKILSWHGRDAGACTVLLGGEKIYLLNSMPAINAMFKLKHSTANRDRFMQTVTCDAMGMPLEDWAKYGPCQHQETQIALEFLLRQSCANEVAKEFSRCHGARLRQEVQVVRAEPGARRQVDLYAWLRTVQFDASVTALMGEHVLEVYPGFADDYASFDASFLDLIFGFSRILKPNAFAARDRAIDGCERWIETVERITGGALLDPRAPGAENSWEPHWGSRCFRARQVLWRKLGMSNRGRAAIELGFTFGLNSNAVPITGWMFMHLLDPRQPRLLERALAEIRPCAALSADEAGGVVIEDLDTQRLAASPLLQSVFHETLRMYTDVLVTRDLFEDVRLPLDDKRASARELLLRKGTRVIAPSLMNQWDPGHFDRPAPADVFCPERFLVPTTGEDPEKAGGEGYTFNPSADGGRIFPWGGGRTMCPGRVVAKQEVLSAIALTLLTFEVVPVDEEAYQIPKLAPSPPGSGGVIPGGDVKVWLKPRTYVKG